MFPQSNPISSRLQRSGTDVDPFRRHWNPCWANQSNGLTQLQTGWLQSIHLANSDVPGRQPSIPVPGKLQENNDQR
jgi:hypothetical protein